MGERAWSTDIMFLSGNTVDFDGGAFDGTDVLKLFGHKSK